MIDIVRFHGESFPLGFTKIHFIKDFFIVLAHTEIDLLKAVKNTSVDIVFHTETIFPKDSLKELQSGLNQVILQYAHQHNVAIGFDFGCILQEKGERRSQLLARMQQNVTLCRKYKTRVVIASLAEDMYGMRGVQDLLAFGRVLGMTGKEAKEALQFTLKQRSVRIS